MACTSETVKLLSSEGEEFVIPKTIAQGSRLIAEVLESHGKRRGRRAAYDASARTVWCVRMWLAAQTAQVSFPWQRSLPRKWLLSWSTSPRTSSSP
jgi:hypothetical protein